ncbi:sulfotransferase family 2 domain-containing protein [Ilumatobacter nonamiensis]|uniref:sulfotransferase family 2 domain-containing protein n=1 Tax=Ilumatobacter nonamiensis TaxID=467093 RepID=UPI00058BDD46|nr:sulfotransferase family 2 domain-containing protein [Ilumatobacter nonamiensis]
MTPVARVSQSALKLSRQGRTFNATIGRTPEFVWYRVAKVATRSIYASLRDAGVDFAAEHPYDVAVPSSLAASVFSFAFVRDPHERVVSAWQDKVIHQNHFELTPSERERLHDFDEFVSFVEELDVTSCDPHLRAQTSLIDLDTIDFVGRFDHLARDFATVCSRLDLPSPQLEQRNRSEPRADPYTPATRTRVASIYRDDISTFGFG